MGVVFLGGFWFCLVWFCLCVCLFGFFVSFVAFASLHALALSLTGAQRTDSSSASKKKESTLLGSASEWVLLHLVLSSSPLRTFRRFTGDH